MTAGIEGSQLGADETRRVAALDSLHLMGTPGEERFDRITRLARELFNVPQAEVTLLDDKNQFTKSPQTPGRSPWIERVNSLCDVTIQSDGMLIIPDASQDARFNTRSSVAGEGKIRFYAGRPLTVGDGQRVGALCVIDKVPREFSAEQQALLEEMSLWVERELRDSEERDRAAEVQRALLPTGQPALPELDFAGICLPARNVGSDFYAWNAVPGGVEVTLADVMGKGAAAAILAAGVRSAFQARIGTEVGSALRQVQDQLEGDLGTLGAFVTVFHGRFDVATGRIDYVDAGHGLSIIVRADGTVDRLKAVGMPLGVVSMSSWDSRTALLGPGDVFLAFTDGLIDLFDDMFEWVRSIADVVRAAVSPQDVVGQIAELNRLHGGGDDVTAVVVARAA